MLESICALLIETTLSGKVEWSDPENTPLIMYPYPTAIIKCGEVYYQISRTNQATGLFELCNNQSVSLGSFQSLELALAVKQNVEARRKSAQFELRQRLAFMADPSSAD